MKAWNHRHPNTLLVFWSFIWLVYAFSTIVSFSEGDFFWGVGFFLVVLMADSRCRYWYDKTGEES